MRKLVIAALAILALDVGVALAGERENVLSHIAQVLAVASMCPNLEVDFVMLSLIGMTYGVDLQGAADEIKAEASRQREPWAGNEKASCIAGMLLYGPQGENVPGLLKWK